MFSWMVHAACFCCPHSPVRIFESALWILQDSEPNTLPTSCSGPNLYLSEGEHTIFSSDPSLRYTCMFPGRCASKQPTNKLFAWTEDPSFPSRLTHFSLGIGNATSADIVVMSKFSIAHDEHAKVAGSSLRTFRCALLQSPCSIPALLSSG